MVFSKMMAQHATDASARRAMTDFTIGSACMIMP